MLRLWLALVVALVLFPLSAGPARAEVDIYVTEGHHLVNGREWRTTCEPYSATKRCRTEIRATQVSFKEGRFVQKTGWVFNNLTYAASPRSLWRGNPLAAGGVVGGKDYWSAEDGRNWRTECDTALTGRGGCRSLIEANVIESVPGGGHRWVTKWIFNNMVRFTADITSNPTPLPTPMPSPAPKPPIVTPAPTPKTLTLRLKAMAVQQGTSVGLTTPQVSSFESIKPERSIPGIDWLAAGRAIVVDARMTAVQGTFPVVLKGSGCVDGVCGTRIEIAFDLKVIGLAAPAGVVDGFPAPSTDRVENATRTAMGMWVLGDEIAITMGPDANRSAASEVAARVGAAIGGGWEDAGIFVLRWAAGQDIAARLQQVAADPRVLSAEAGRMQRLGDTSLVGYADETAYSVTDTWHLDMIGAPRAWTRSTGAGVPLGIHELSVVNNHVDLPPPSRVVLPHLDDSERGHATHVAGLACARDNGLGVIGIASECRLISSGMNRYRAQSAPGDLVYVHEPIEGIRQMLLAGARVINMSWGLHLPCAASEEGSTTGEIETQVCGQEILDEIMDTNLSVGDGSVFTSVAKHAHGTLFVFAAGNDGLPIVTNMLSRGAVRDRVGNVLNVASIDSNWNLSFFSNFGPEVDIAAPGGFGPDGQGILSTGHGFFGQSSYVRMSGTSMAAPLVAGTAALVAQRHPDWSGAQIADHLITTGGDARVSERNSRKGQKFPFVGSIPVLNADAATTELIPEPEPTPDPSETTPGDVAMSSIVDPGLRRCIARAGGIGVDETLTGEAAASIKTLRCGISGVDFIRIQTLQGLPELPNVNWLDLFGNEVRDVGPLAKLKNLTYLDLSYNMVSDVSALARLTNLNELNLLGNYVNDVSSLAGLTELTRADLSFNPLTDVRPLARLTDLTSLRLVKTRVLDVGSLAGLTNLGYLDLSQNQLSDVSSLAELTNLGYLDLSQNDLSDVSPLAGLTNLSFLNLSNNPVANPETLDPLRDRGCQVLL